MSRRRPLSYFDDIRETIVNGGSDRGGWDARLNASSALWAIFNNATSEDYRLMHVNSFNGFRGHRNTEVHRRIAAYATAMFMAMQDFNEGNLTLVDGISSDLLESCNIRMTMEFTDTIFTPRFATQAMISLPRVDSGSLSIPPVPTAVLGGIRSAVAVPLAAISSLGGTPHLSHAASTSRLDNRDSFPLFGRTCPSNDGQARAMMDYLNGELGVTHVGLLFINDEYGNGFRLALSRAAEEAGVTLETATFDFEVSSDQDDANLISAVTSAIDELRKTRFRYFVGAFFATHLQTVVDQATKAGIMGPDFFWLFGHAIGRDGLRTLQAPKGSAIVPGMHGLASISYRISSPTFRQQAFEDSVRRRRSDPEFVTYIHDKLPFEPEEAAEFYNKYALVDQVYDISAFAYDAVMAMGLAACQISGGFFTGEEFWAEILRTKFDGTSGRLALDPKTGSRKDRTVSYDIYNAVTRPVNDESMVLVDVFPALRFNSFNVTNDGQSAWAAIDGYQFNFSDKTMYPPSAYPPLEAHENTVELPIFAFFTSLAGVVMLSAVAFGIWTWINRNTRIIRASQPGFLISLCVGVFFMAGSVIFMGADSPPFSFEFANASCMAAYWCYCPGLGLAMSALFAKTWRINKILQRENYYRRVVVEPRHVILPGILIIFGNILMLILWQILAPLRLVRSFESYASLDEFGRRNEWETRCESDEGSFSSAYFLAGLFAVNGIVVIAANFQAYRARNITTEFSESRYIAISMLVILQALILALPVFFFEVDKKANFLSKAVLALLSSSAVLYIIFIPKIVLWRRYLKLRSQQQEMQQRRRAHGPHHLHDDTSTVARQRAYRSRQHASAMGRRSASSIIMSGLSGEGSRSEKHSHRGVDVIVDNRRSDERSIERDTGDLSSGLRVWGKAGNSQAQDDFSSWGSNESIQAAEAPLRHSNGPSDTDNEKSFYDASFDGIALDVEESLEISEMMGAVRLSNDSGITSDSLPNEGGQ